MNLFRSGPFQELKWVVTCVLCCSLSAVRLRVFCTLVSVTLRSASVWYLPFHFPASSSAWDAAPTVGVLVGLLEGGRCAFKMAFSPKAVS